MPTILGVILGEAPGTTRPSRTGLYPLALPGIAVPGIVTLGYRAPDMEGLVKGVGQGALEVRSVRRWSP